MIRDRLQPRIAAAWRSGHDRCQTRPCTAGRAANLRRHGEKLARAAAGRRRRRTRPPTSAAGSSAGCATRSASRGARSAEQLQAAAFDPGDDASWERLEEALIYADVGVRATAELIRRLEARQDLDRAERQRSRRRSPRSSASRRRSTSTHDPAVILVVGVNGTGKTTTIGKLASRLRESGRDVTVGAADTFRAAAEEQLEIWAERADATVRRRRARRRPGRRRLRRGRRRAAASCSSTPRAACTRSRT